MITEGTSASKSARGVSGTKQSLFWTQWSICTNRRGNLLRGWEIEIEQKLSLKVNLLQLHLRWGIGSQCDSDTEGEHRPQESLTWLAAKVIITGLRGKASPVEMLPLWRERYPASQKTRVATKSYWKANLPWEIYWERHKRVAASAQARNSREQSKKQALYRVSRGAKFSRVVISKAWNWWNFKQSQMIVGEILSSGIDGCSGSETGGLGAHRLVELRDRWVLVVFKPRSEHRPFTRQLSTWYTIYLNI